MPGLEPASLLEDRLHDLARRARVGRRLEHDELARLEVRGDRVRGALDVAEVGLALLRQRRRESDQDRVGLPELLVVEGRGDPAVRDERLERFGGDVLDVASPGVDPLDDLGDDVDEQDALPGICEGLCKRQADIAGADDGNVPGPAHGVEGYRAAAIRPLASPSP